MDLNIGNNNKVDSKNDNESVNRNLADLEARTRQYLAEVKELQFAEYLRIMLGRIQRQQQQVELLANELDRSYQMYENRMRLAGNAGDAIVQSESVAVQPEDFAQAEETVIIEQTEKIEDEPSQQASPYFDLNEKEPFVQRSSVQNSSARRKSGIEFTIGTALLSVVGGSFILIALVMFGVNFMNGFAKGMCLYGCFLALMIISELIIYRKWPKLGIAFTAISIGGLYLSTIINYLTLGNINMWVAMAVSLLIGIVVVLLSRKRDSFGYRTLGLLTCYFSLLLLPEESSLQEIIVLTAITLIINIMCICLPLQRRKTGFNILHMYAAGIYTFLLNCIYYEEAGTELASLVAVISAVLILQILLVVQVRYQRKESEANRTVGKKGITVAYFLNGLLILFSLSGDVIWNAYGIEHWMRHGFCAGIVIIAFIATWLLRKGAEMWYPYLYASITAYSIYCMSENDWETVICMAVLLGITKCLSLCKASILKGTDAVLTTVCCMMCLGYRYDMEWYAIVPLLCVLLSVLFIRYWQTYFEIILTFTLAFFAIAKLPTVLQLQTFVGTLFVGILIFNNVKWWQGKYIKVYNYLVLTAQVICFLLLLNPIYRNVYLVYLCMLIFGLATIILTFQDKYQMNFKYKNLILAIFLTYMAFVIRTKYPIINSILMMLIALGSVGFGFVTKEKNVRIYGLVLSLIICGKITLYDFFGAATLQKVILFLVVGIIALAIAAIYIVLEKKIEIKQSE